MIPEFPELKLVELSDKEELKKYFRLFPPEICELTFANVYIWRDWEKTQLTKIKGNLCLLCSPPDEAAYFLEPVGNNQLEKTIETCLSMAPRLSRVSEGFLNRISKNYEIQEDRDNFDYVYLTEELIGLKGKKFDGKRNWVKRFMKQYQYEVRRLAEFDIAACLDLVERWEASSPEKNILADDRSRAAAGAIIEALKNFQSLELEGIAILVDSRLEGFCLGEKLNSETAVIHIELASREISGLYQFLNRECARTAWRNFLYINREQDAGIAGLRRSKLSYHPHHLVKKYNIFR